jgi:hypothetical protein
VKRSDLLAQIEAEIAAPPRSGEARQRTTNSIA